MSRDGELLFSLMYIFSMSTKVRGGGVKRSASRSYIGGQIGDTLAKLQYGSLTSLGANIFLRVLDCEMNSWKTHTISSILWCSSNSRRVPLETPPTPSWVRAGPGLHHHLFGVYIHGPSELDSR
jgi:hypothetical protein